MQAAPAHERENGGDGWGLLRTRAGCRCPGGPPRGVATGRARWNRDVGTGRRVMEPRQEKQWPVLVQAVDVEGGAATGADVHALAAETGTGKEHGAELAFDGTVQNPELMAAGAETLLHDGLLDNAAGYAASCCVHKSEHVG